MKSKDVCYLKYFVSQCREKIENREIALEKSSIDKDYFVMYKSLLKAAVTRMNELTC